eukprot:scpid99680/ scgid24803/ 
MPAFSGDMRVSCGLAGGVFSTGTEERNAVKSSMMYAYYVVLPAIVTIPPENQSCAHCAVSCVLYCVRLVFAGCCVVCAACAVLCCVCCVVCAACCALWVVCCVLCILHPLLVDGSAPEFV